MNKQNNCSTRIVALVATAVIAIVGGGYALYQCGKGKGPESGPELRFEASTTNVVDPFKGKSLPEIVDTDVVDPFTGKTLPEIVGMARNGETAVLREMAVRKLPYGDYDKELAYIAKTDPFGRVREAAIEKMTDAAVLAEIAESEEVPFIKVRALEKVVDKAVLEHFAKHDHSLVARTAAKRLEALFPNR